MRLMLWHEVHAVLTLACMGPGGSGFPGALGACALAKVIGELIERLLEILVEKSTGTRMTTTTHGCRSRLESPSRALTYRKEIGIRVKRSSFDFAALAL